MVARPWLAVAFLLLAVGLLALALSKAVGGYPVLGVSFSPDETNIEAVLPGGPAWRSGVRPGQPVLSLSHGETIEEWTLTVLSPEWGSTRVSASRSIEVLRETLPRVLVGVLLVLLALPALRLDRRVATALAAVAVCATEATMLASGEPAPSSAAAAATLLMPAAWLATYAPRRSAGLLWLTLALLVAAAWLLTRHVAWERFEPFETARIVVTFSGAAAVGVVALGSAVARMHGGYDSRRLGDLGIIAAVGALLVVLVGAGMPLVALAVAVAVPLLAFPFARARLAGTADRLIHGDLREQASAAAVEAERGRVAREIHDEALQRLADVIRRLDGRGIDAEANALRDIAAQLREVTTSLQPPVLQDVGIGAALDALVVVADAGSSVRVTLTLDDRTMPDPATRPPADVEVAIFRIAQEAITNAIRHSSANDIIVTAEIAPDRCRVTVIDDGVGIDPVAARTAGSRGRLGLRSMEQRAALIGADFAISGRKPGTVVSVEWHR